MRRKLLSLFIAFSVLFTGCSSKNIHPISKNVEIHTFLTDKDENFYLFVGDKYSYVFSEKETLRELKEIVTLARSSSGKWTLTNQPKIYLDKDFVAKVNMTFLFRAEENQFEKLESLGFKAGKKYPNFYYKDIELLGKYGQTDKEIKEEFKQNNLSHTISFEEISLVETEEKEVPMVLKIVGGIIGAPFAVVGFVVFYGLFATLMIGGCLIASFGGGCR